MSREERGKEGGRIEGKETKIKGVAENDREKDTWQWRQTERGTWGKIGNLLLSPFIQLFTCSHSINCSAKGNV